jgi:multimeric flavodoxin WrbA
MRVVIFNGNPDPTNEAFDGYLEELAAALESAGHSAKRLCLRDMDIRQCIGCFGCWLKTPGVCVSPDQHGDTLRAYLGADAAVFASPLRMGFTSALLKRMTDKLLPSLLPYVDPSTGECRHFRRYASSPRFAVVYQDEPETDDEDRALTAEMWARLARNAHTRLTTSCPISTPAKEVAHAIASA